MSSRVADALFGGLAGLRHEPTAKHVRAELDGTTVIDSVRAVVLWEPRRVVATYAVPATDVHADLRPAGAVTAAPEDVGYVMPDLSSRPVLDPSIPFDVHTADGEPVDVVAGGRTLGRAGFRLHDPDLDGYVVVDFDAFSGTTRPLLRREGGRAGRRRAAPPPAHAVVVIGATHAAGSSCPACQRSV